ncbi:hypothetical protein BT93_C2095 [Corymbia citriodora subsp. variegata]|nr:hypothetical protein BT93_C2095 [Corymbia citriodora subsp. variegata]
MACPVLIVRHFPELIIGSSPKMADQREKKLRTQNDDEVTGGDGEAISVELPVDMVTDILVRLPVKTLLQFKCVSKPWCSIIAEPFFADSVLASFLACPSVSTVVSICNPFGPGGSLCRFFRLDHQTGLSTPIPLPDMPSGPHVKVLGSINGFICLNDEDLTHLCNPSTREIAALPLTGPNFPAHLLGKIESFAALGYDPASKRYKVLKTWILYLQYGGVVAAHKVLTLGTNSWRIVDDCPIKSPWDDCICAEGAIHILTYDRMDRNVVVVTFNIVSEKFSMLLPPGGAVGSARKFKLKLFGEHLALLEYLHLWDNDMITMYVLDDYGSQAWKELRIVLPNSWKEGILGTSFFISITRNGDILLFHTVLHRQAASYLVSYNVESKSMRKVQIHGPPCHRFKGLAVLKCAPFDFVDNILSLNHLNS